MRSANVLPILLLVVALAGCSQCGRESDPAVAQALRPSQVQKDSTPLSVESIAIGLSKAAFRRSAASLVQVSDAETDAHIVCGPQQAVAVIDPVHGRIDERVPDGVLTFCLATPPSGRSTPLLSARGIFLNDGLVGASILFAPAERSSLTARLQRRFGTGEERTLTDESDPRRQSLVVRLWEVDHTLWALFPSSRTVEVVVQKIPTLAELPTRSDAPRTKLDKAGISDQELEVDLSGVDEPR
jgi:hypothetical protein